MSRLVRRLERRGVISVHEDPLDGRAAILRATANGRQMHLATMARRRELMAEALGARAGALPDDLATGLAAIADALERYG